MVVIALVRLGVAVLAFLRPVLFSWPFALLAAPFGCCSLHAQQQLPTRPTLSAVFNETDRDVVRVRSQLATPVDIHEQSTNLVRVLATVGAQCDVEFRFDDSLAGETPVKEVIAFRRPLWQTLDRLLEPLGYSWIATPDFIRITDPDKARAHLMTDVYQIGELIPVTVNVEQTENIEPVVYDHFELISTIKQIVTVDEWPGEESMVSIGGNQNALLVRHHWWAHEEIHDLLEKLRRCRRLTARSPNAKPVPAYALPITISDVDQQRREIEKRLLGKISLQVANTPLTHVIRQIAGKSGLSVKLDFGAMRAAGQSPTERIAIRFDNISVREALRRLATAFGLKTRIQDGEVLLTMFDEDPKAVVTRVYPVSAIARQLAKEDDSRSGYSQLVQVIREFIAPYSWTNGDGMVVASEFNGALVIRNTKLAHTSIRELVSHFRNLTTMYAENQPAAERARVSPLQQRMLRQLEQRLRPTPMSSRLYREARGEIVLVEEVPVKVDAKYLDMSGFDSRKVVSLLREAETLESVADEITRKNLKLTICDDGFFITTPQFLATKLTTHVYPIRDLIPDVGYTKKGDKVRSELVDIISAIIRSDEWEAAGGEGRIREVGGALVIYQRGYVHEQVVELLAAVRTARDAQGTNRVLSRPLWGIGTDRAIQRALQENCDLKVIDATLNELVRAVSRQHRIPVQLSTRHLELLGLDGDTKVSGRFKGIPLATALRYILQDVELETKVLDGVLWLTVAEDRLPNEARIYYVADLVESDEQEDDDAARNRLERLVETISVNVAPDTWDVVGGEGSIYSLASTSCLVIANSADVHLEVERVLGLLRGARRAFTEWDGYSTPPSVFPAPNALTEAHVQILRELKRPAKIHFEDESLRLGLRSLATVHRMNIYLNYHSLDTIGISADSFVTLPPGDDELGESLAAMLEPLELNYTIDGGVLVIAVAGGCDDSELLRAYPVFDILARDDSASTPVHQRLAAYDDLAEALSHIITPDNWDEVGGIGVITPLPMSGCLIIYQTKQAHEELEALFETHRRLRRAHQQQMGVAVTRPYCVGANYADREELLRKTRTIRCSVRVKEKPLSDIILQLCAEHDLPVRISRRVVLEWPEKLATVSEEIDDEPISEVLSQLLAPHELTWKVLPDKISITANDTGDVVARFYPVADLLEADPGKFSVGELWEITDQLKREAVPGAWDGWGSSQVIQNPPALLIAQSEDVHWQIEKWLAKRRAAREK